MNTISAFSIDGATFQMCLSLRLEISSFVIGLGL